MKKVFMFFVVVSSVMLLFACDFTKKDFHVSGDMIDFVTELDNISKLEIEDIHLKKGVETIIPKVNVHNSEEKKVVISCNEGFKEELNVSTSNGKLRIAANDKYEYIITDFSINIYGCVFSSIVLENSNLITEANTVATDLYVSAGGASTAKVDLTNVTKAEFKISGASSGSVVEANIVDNLSIKVSGASSFFANLNDCDVVNAEISGASRLSISGTAKDGTFDVSGASEVSAEDLVLSDGDFDISGASRIKIKEVTSTIKYDVSGASSFTFSGEAEVIKSDVSGASSVKKQ